MKEEFEERLQAMDVEPILFLLVSAEDGPKWTVEQARLAEKWYRRFHHLVHEYPSQTIVPTRAIDDIWHFHILDTEKYMDDCLSLHGHFIHHYPYLGVRNRQDKAALTSAYEETLKLFVKKYGESPEEIEILFGRNSSTGAVICGGRCSNDVLSNSRRNDGRPRLSQQH